MSYFVQNGTSGIFSEFSTLIFHSQRQTLISNHPPTLRNLITKDLDLHSGRRAGQKNRSLPCWRDRGGRFRSYFTCYNSQKIVKGLLSKERTRLLLPSLQNSGDENGGLKNQIATSNFQFHCAQQCAVQLSSVISVICDGCQLQGVSGIGQIQSLYSALPPQPSRHPA